MSRFRQKTTLSVTLVLSLEYLSISTDLGQSIMQPRLGLVSVAGTGTIAVAATFRAGFRGWDENNKSFLALTFIKNACSARLECDTLAVSGTRYFTERYSLRAST